MSSISKRAVTNVNGVISVSAHLVTNEVRYRRLSSQPTPKPELELDIRKDMSGRTRLFFPFLTVSDTHLGTRYSRARRLSHMLQNISAEKVMAVGDIVDMQYMLGKKRWNFPPWHRQALAHLLRKNAQYFTGNHDDALRGTSIIVNGKTYSHRQSAGKIVQGISIVDEDLYVDPKGRVILIKHGDEYDNTVFGRAKGFWYEVGDYLHAPIANFDYHVRNLTGIDGFSVAAHAKKIVKLTLNKGLGIEQKIIHQLDQNPNIDGLLYGHSHDGGIKKTPMGKILMNDGCTTDRVNCIVHDRKGVFAYITWRKNRMNIVEENGARRTVYWKDIGLDSFLAQPENIEDEHTKLADRFIRIIYRLAPPKERRLYFEKLHRAVAINCVPPPIPASIQLPIKPDQKNRSQHNFLKEVL